MTPSMTAAAQATMSEAIKELSAEWSAFQKRTVSFGQCLYKWRETFAAQGNHQGHGFLQVLEEVGVPTSTAYYWIARYEESIGVRQERIKPETIAPEPTQAPPPDVRFCSDCGAVINGCTLWQFQCPMCLEKRQISEKEQNGKILNSLTCADCSATHATCEADGKRLCHICYEKQRAINEETRPAPARASGFNGAVYQNEKARVADLSRGRFNIEGFKQDMETDRFRQFVVTYRETFRTEEEAVNMVNALYAAWQAGSLSQQTVSE